MKNLFSILLAILGIVIACTTAGSEELRLKKISTNQVEVTAEGKTYWYDQAISAEEARKVFDHFRKMTNDPVPSIHAVPGMKGYYLVSTWAGVGKTPSDYGRRLYLIRKKDNGFEEIDRTHGAGDSYSLKPVFFVGSGKRLILAEMATEYSWGLLVYEITRGRLRELGALDAAVMGDEDADDPTPYARVKYKNGKWAIEFDHDLVLDPGGTGDREIRRKDGKPIVFEYDGTTFVPREGTYLPEKK